MRAPSVTRVTRVFLKEYAHCTREGESSFALRYWHAWAYGRRSLAPSPLDLNVEDAFSAQTLTPFPRLTRPHATHPHREADAHTRTQRFLDSRFFSTHERARTNARCSSMFQLCQSTVDGRNIASQTTAPEMVIAYHRPPPRPPWFNVGLVFRRSGGDVPTAKILQVVYEHTAVSTLMGRGGGGDLGQDGRWHLLSYRRFAGRNSLAIFFPSTV